MAAEMEVQEILDGSFPDGSVPVSANEGSRTITLAAEEINRLLNAAGTNLLTICQTVVRSTTKKSLQAAFRDLNDLTTVLTEIDRLGLHDDLDRDALAWHTVS